MGTGRNVVATQPRKSKVVRAVVVVCYAAALALLVAPTPDGKIPIAEITGPVVSLGAASGFLLFRQLFGLSAATNPEERAGGRSPIGSGLVTVLVIGLIGLGFTAWAAFATSVGR